MIEPGDEAPDFALRDQDGREAKLSDFAGQMLVHYVYPKADTPGTYRGIGTARSGEGRLPI